MLGVLDDHSALVPRLKHRQGKHRPERSAPGGWWSKESCPLVKTRDMVATGGRVGIGHDGRADSGIVDFTLMVQKRVDRRFQCRPWQFNAQMQSTATSSGVASYEVP